MRLYPEEQKAQLIERMLGSDAVSVPVLHRETGIPKDTLYGWRRQAQHSRGLPVAASGNDAQRWGAKEKFAMVVETAPMNEVERGAYCRKRGVYPEQLERWRQVCEQANSDAGGTPGAGKRNDPDKRRVRELERELKRKEKALAEAAALLVLRKKAQAIWGDGEDG